MAMNGNSDMEDHKLILDSPIPKGKFWWDQCSDAP